MARASFTLKRYLPINTTVAENSDWRVFNSRPASGASTSGVAPLDGATSFDIIIRASSPKWIVDSIATSTQALFWVGEAGTTQTMFWYLNGADAGAAAGCFETMFYINSQSAITRSSPVPFVDGTTYWFKYSFDGDALTGTYSYAADQPTEPTSWTTISTTSSTLSNLTSYTGMNTTDMVAVGLYDPDQTLVDNTFNGTIYRAIVRTRAGLTTEYFYYTGASEAFTVPAGVTSVDALLWGGGRSGGQTFGTMSVFPGDVLTIRVGGVNNGRLGGWPNGGTGGANTYFNSYSAGGAGSSDIFLGSTPLMVAGGQGGDSPMRITDPLDTDQIVAWGTGGGSGTTTNTYNPTINTPNGCMGYVLSWGGRGGSQEAGGGAGYAPSGKTWITAYPTAGAYGQGGNGASTNASYTGLTSGTPYNASGGGGGGGYYGGGGGGINTSGVDPTQTKYGGTGGGGSSYVNTSVCSNYRFSARSVVNRASNSSWYAAGARNLSSNTYEYVPIILTDSTDGSSCTVVYGPPQPDFDLSSYNGLVALRYFD